MINNTSECLKSNIDRILVLWKQRAITEIPSSSGVSPVLLQNELNRFLHQIADALSKTIDRTVYRIKKDEIESAHFGRTHGTLRASAITYTLADTIREFQVLHQVIIKVLEEESPLTGEDRDILSSSIEKAIVDAASQFADVQREHQEQFTMTIAHDLRTPIGIAKMNAYMLKKHFGDNEHATSAAKMIDKNMDRLENMLRELLDVSRYRAGKNIIIDNAEMRLDTLAQEVINDLSILHGDRFKLESEPVYGAWNKDALRRVIENLAVNAIKYGSQGTPVKIIIKQHNGNASITVHNEGNPISAEEQPKLFDKYRRGASATSKTGWGLGLALVLAMVQAHDGAIRVESSEAAGTDFIVMLPKLR